jgi:hypothetical protein
MIEDLASGRFYRVPEKSFREQSLEEVLSTQRVDYVTGCRFDISREIANQKLAAIARARSDFLDARMD